MVPRSQGRIPGRSGTFEDCVARLPELRAMGFDVIYFPPIHPIGRVNRKGRDNSLTLQPGDPGSLYAIGSVEGGHETVHPELGGPAGFRKFAAAARSCGSGGRPGFRDPMRSLITPGSSLTSRSGSASSAGRHFGNTCRESAEKYQDIVNLDFYNRDRDELWLQLARTSCCTGSPRA